jgi:hypothetical protein
MATAPAAAPTPIVIAHPFKRIISLLSSLLCPKAKKSPLERFIFLQMEITGDIMK